MTDLTTLEALIIQITKIDFSQSSEQDTREIVVNPIIGKLGWDTFNPHEVAREYSVLGGRVDYCLRTEKKNHVLIEVKRAGADLGDHQKQLLRYAFDEGTPLAVLTDGFMWQLYLPMAPGNWLQRRFAEISLHEQKPTEVALILHRFLSRDSLIRGTAINEANREFESQERDRLIRVAFHEAWQHILSNPESLLRNLLAETVEEISDHRPDEGKITEFLQEVSGSQEGIIRTDPRNSASHTNNHIKNATHKLKTRSTSPKLQAFWLDGERYAVTTWRGMLVKLCEILNNKEGSTFAERVIKMKGRKCPYFSKLQSELREPKNIPGTRLYVETNISRVQAENIARQVLTRVRNSDEGFGIDN